MKFLLIFGYLGSFLAGCSAGSRDAEDRHAESAAARTTIQKPNIIFILADDLGWRDVGFNGSKYYQTPNLDRLAGKSMVFAQCYMNPDCAPSRASLMTGQYPPRTGIYAVDGYARTPDEMMMLKPVRSQKILPTEKITVAEVLKQAGYATGHFGKWHLGNDTITWPQGQGFDVNVAGCDRGAPATYFSPYTGLKNITPGKKDEYLTERLTDEALNFIKKNKDRPFFLYLPFYSVHVPLHATRAYVDLYRDRPGVGQQNIAAYGAMITCVDYSIGRVLNYLRTSGIADKTIVIFTSDNGGQLMCTDNAPLRGQKGSFYEGGIRVPMLVHWPGKIMEPVRCDTPVSVVDFFPTLAEMAGAKLPPGQPLDGQSIIPLLTGQGAWNDRSLFWHLPAYHGNGKTNALVWQDPAGVIRQGKWKLIEHFENGYLELFNIGKDAAEQHNLVDKEPEVAKHLLEDLKQWQHDINAPIPVERNPDFYPGKRLWIRYAHTRTVGEAEKQIVIKEPPK